MFISLSYKESSFSYTTNTGKKAQRKRIRKIYNLLCDNCKNYYERTSKNFSPKRANNNHEHFCGLCDNPFRLASKSYYRKNPNKHDHLLGTKITDSHGYINIYVGKDYKYLNDSTSSVYGGRIREHIFVMENYLSRKLEKGEVVHHIDGDKSNNDISNLDLCTVQEHNLLHAKASTDLIFELYKKGIVGYDKDKKSYFIH